MTPSRMTILFKTLTPIFFISNETASFKTSKFKFLALSELLLESYEANTENHYDFSAIYLISLSI